MTQGSPPERPGPRATVARVALSRIVVDPSSTPSATFDRDVSGRIRVILVDLAPAPLDAFLVNAGYEVAAVETAAGALAVVDRNVPDVVIVGTQTKDATPLASLRVLHSRMKVERVPLMQLLPATADDEAAEEALLFGADVLLLAPVRAPDIIARVRTLSRLRRDHLRLAREHTRLLEEVVALRKLIVHDPLTGVGNRRLVDRRLAEEVERSNRYGQALTVVLIDIDHFGRINDTHGRLVGDSALRAIAAVLAGCVRLSDVIGRFDQDTFLVIAPATAVAGARILTERLRSTIETTSFSATGNGDTVVSLRTTASVGFACLHAEASDPSMDADALLGRATLALGLAKKSGRNRVESAE